MAIRVWVLLGVAAATLVWVPLLLGLRPQAPLGCLRGAASSPAALLRFVAAGQAVAASPPSPGGANPVVGRRLHIVVDAGARRLLLFADGELYRSWPVAVGTPQTPTPIGHWLIQHKAVCGGAFGARWLQVSIPWGTYGIHGTNNPGSIGARASHGCIRMYNRDVIELYGLVTVGTPVDIRGRAVARFGETRRVIVPTLIGSDVLQLQRTLQAAGYDVGALDGVYGGKSVAAVRRFQAEHGLAATGTVDFATAAALGLMPLAEDPSLRPAVRGAPVPAPRPRPGLPTGAAASPPGALP